MQKNKKSSCRKLRFRSAHWDWKSDAAVWDAKYGDKCCSSLSVTKFNRQEEQEAKSSLFTTVWRGVTVAPLELRWEFPLFPLHEVASHISQSFCGGHVWTLHWWSLQQSQLRTQHTITQPSKPLPGTFITHPNYKNKIAAYKTHTVWGPCAISIGCFFHCAEK